MSIGSIHINVVNIPPTEIASTEIPTLLELTLRDPPYRDCLCQVHPACECTPRPRQDLFRKLPTDEILTDKIEMPLLTNSPCCDLKISPAFRELSSKIHADPELGNVEYHSHDLLTSYLAGLSFTAERHTYGIPTVFVTEFVFGTGRRVGREKGRVYDALPVVGHACGHNLIAVSNVAAAVAVKTAPRGPSLLPESNDGKIDLLRKNAFQSRVDACMMVHPTRVFISFDREGSWYEGHHLHSVLAIDRITANYYGRASHAAESTASSLTVATPYVYSPPLFPTIC
ncbi:hypothetical protein BC936DRAFT_148312 [Jimgerdemannia flammicorona]|uniref:Peptidase M20 dimerisation domain-containing protein n=1 Tax=Jimgerdemannia flammicorona TaxID=994334 RepID=A0A433D3C3_9FUNG|nr:hypothetical protein BC936DRAFT_148312 [Jimgerdemannia flammicorona]